MTATPYDTRKESVAVEQLAYNVWHHATTVTYPSFTQNLWRTPKDLTNAFRRVEIRAKCHKITKTYTYTPLCQRGTSHTRIPWYGSACYRNIGGLHKTQPIADAESEQLGTLNTSQKFLCRDGVNTIRLLQIARNSLLEDAKQWGGTALIDESWTCEIYRRKRNIYEVRVSEYHFFFYGYEKEYMLTKFRCYL